MRLESLRVRNCFGFVDSGEIKFDEPGGLIYFLGRNSSGKTSVLRALSSLQYGVTPQEQVNFWNYETPEGMALLRARYSLGMPGPETSLSVERIVEAVVAHFESVPANIQKGGDGYVSESGSSPGVEIARTLNTVEQVYSDLVEAITESGVVWVDKLEEGSYRFLGTHENPVGYEARREAIVEALGGLRSGVRFSVRSGSAQTTPPLSFEMIERRLFEQFPEIYLFTERFSLKDDLPRAIGHEHLDGRQNALSEAFMDLLNQQTLRSFLRASTRRKLDELEGELQARLDRLCDNINEDVSAGGADELVRIFIDRRGEARIVLDVGGKESYYEHLSDNTKFLVAYHVFREDRERKDAQASLLLFDEPNQGFHPTAEGKMLRFLETLAERGNQVVVTTHSQYMIDSDRLSAIRLMGRDEETGTLRVSNSIYKPALPGGDLLALRPVTEAIGLRYAEQLVVKDKVIVTEGYTDMLCLRAFRRILGRELDLNVAPLRGDPKLGQFVPFLISQGLAFKVILDSEAVKENLRRNYPIPEEHFFVVEEHAGSASGTGIEDLLTKEDLTRLLSRYGLEVNEKKLANIPNGAYVGQEKIKGPLATMLYSDEAIGADTFERESLEAFGRLLDFCVSEDWYRD